MAWNNWFVMEKVRLSTAGMPTFFSTWPARLKPNYRARNKSVGSTNWSKSKAICATLRWAVEHEEAILGLRLSAALVQFWYKRGFWTEGRRWLETFLELHTASQQTALDAEALYGLGLMVICTGSCGDARSVLERCLGVSREVEATDWSARALAMLGTLAHRLGYHEEGQRFFSASLKHFEALDDHWSVVTTLSRRVYSAFLAGIDSVLDKAAFQRSLTLFHPASDTAYTAHIVKSLGVVCYYQGRYGEARALIDECVQLSRRGEFVSHTASELAFLSMIEVAQGDLETAAEHLHESITILATAGHRFAIAEAFDAFSLLAFARQQPTQVLRFGGAAAAVRAAIGVRPIASGWHLRKRPPATRPRRGRRRLGGWRSDDAG